LRKSERAHLVRLSARGGHTRRFVDHVDHDHVGMLREQSARARAGSGVQDGAAAPVTRPQQARLPKQMHAP
jgi:hypothetical protein